VAARKTFVVSAGGRSAAEHEFRRTDTFEEARYVAEHLRDFYGRPEACSTVRDTAGSILWNSRKNR
jgi:hypothetical protein